MSLVEYYKKILSEAYSRRANRIEKSATKQEQKFVDKYDIKDASDAEKLTPEELKKYTGTYNALEVARNGLDVRNHQISLRLKNENPQLFNIFARQATKTLAPIMDEYKGHPDFENLMAPMIHMEIGKIYSTQAQRVNNPRSALNDPMNFEARQIKNQFGSILDLMKKKK